MASRSHSEGKGAGSENVDPNNVPQGFINYLSEMDEETLERMERDMEREDKN